MRKYIYASESKIYDRNDRKHDIYVGFTDHKEDDRFVPRGKYYSHEEFATYVKDKKPKGIVFAFDTQDEFDYVIDQFFPFLISLDVCAKHNRAFDFTSIEKCSELEAINLYWNTKQETLWDVRKNTKLKSFEIKEYYKISDFSAFCGSSIEKLMILGCNGFSSFASKMHVDDLDFLLDMPCLKELRLDIIKDESSEYYLNLLAQCQKIDTLYIPDGFFTFQQFAWLRAHLPNVREGLDCVFYGSDFYAIIGRRMPNALEDASKVERYQKRYDTLVERYRTRENPPSDEEKN